MSRTEAMNPILNTGEASPWQQASFPGVQGRSPPKHGLVLPSAGGRPAEEVLQGRGQPGDGCWGSDPCCSSNPLQLLPSPPLPNVEVSGIRHGWSGPGGHGLDFSGVRGL